MSKGKDVVALRNPTVVVESEAATGLQQSGKTIKARPLSNWTADLSTGSFADVAVAPRVRSTSRRFAADGATSV